MMTNIDLSFRIPDDYASSILKDWNTNGWVNARLTITENHSYDSDINLVIYASFPWEKDLFYKLFKETTFNIFDLIDEVEVTSEDNCQIDFSKTSYTNITLQSGENLQSASVDEIAKTIFTLSEVTIIYNHPDDDRPEIAFFKLNESAQKMIERGYIYERSEDKSQWKAINNSKPVEVENYLLKFEFEFSYMENNVGKLEIHKKPRLVVVSNDKSQDDIEGIANVAEVTCSFMTFIRNEIISYKRSVIYCNGHKYITYKSECPVGVSDSKYDGLVFLDADDRYKKYYDVINRIEYNRWLKDADHIKMIVDRLVLSKLMNGESKFMILYNILEQLKTVLSPKEKAAKFKFSAINISEIIREALLSLSSYVEEEDKLGFEEHVVNHVGTLQYKKMANQFDSIMNTYHPKCDRNKLLMTIKLRSKIFHGHLNYSKDDLGQANGFLRLTIRTIIYKSIFKNSLSITSGHDEQAE